MTSYKVEISTKTIYQTIGLILGLWVTYQIRSILVMIFVSFILMTAITPVIKFASKYKIPSIIVVLAIYFLLIALLSTLIASLVPAVIQQTSSLANHLPEYISGVERFFNNSINFDLSSGYFSSIPSNLFKLVGGTFSNLVNILTLFFMSYYLILERPNLHKYLMHFIPNHDREQKAERIVKDVEKGVGGWVRGQLFLMLIIGVMTYLGLLLLGIPYVLPLAVLAGLLEVVPSIGPTVAAIPAVIIGFTISPIVGFGALAMSILIQQLESVFIVPKVMQSATGINPLVTLTSLVVGYTLGGIMGAVLAIPLYLSIVIIIRELSS